MRRTVFGLVTCVAASLAVVPDTVDAATRLTVTGRLTSVGSDAAVLLIADDGTSVRATVGKSGKFTIKVPTKVANKFVVRKTGKGSTLHILQSGEYAGPVVLNKASSTKGWTRLTSKKSGTISVGTIAMKTGYAIGKTTRSVIDTSRTIRMKKSIPVGSRGLLDQMLIGPVRSFAALTRDAATLGADADRDGLPNLADADMNGDGVIDAAQVAGTDKFDGLASDVVLANRPPSLVGFQKILEEGWTEKQVNSNVNPDATEDDIRKSIAQSLSLEMGMTLGDVDFASTSVVLDCRKLSYCSPGSVSRVLGFPGEAIDGKSLVELQNSDGLITLPQRQGESTYLLRFFPGMASAAEGNLVGDTFELRVVRGGQVVASEAKVVTSSVVVTPAITSVGGTSLLGRGHPNGLFSQITDAKAMPVTFYRPQAFANGSTSELVDRGGLEYNISVWPFDGSNTGYPCPSSALSGLSSSLTKSVVTDPNVVQTILDTDVVPSANGTLLGFTVDVPACVAHSKSPRHSVGSGQRWVVELEASDSDNNRARARTQFIVP